MDLKGKYWRDDPDAPFAVLLDTIEAYCHPEAYDEAYDDLSARVARGRDSAIQQFKSQLKDALCDPERLPVNALYRAAQYDESSDLAFLQRLWRDLYPNEPAPRRS